MANVMVVTLVSRSGAICNFETTRLTVQTNADGKPIMEWARKDNGLSLMYVDQDEIFAIIRDTTPQAATDEALDEE